MISQNYNFYLDLLLIIFLHFNFLQIEKKLKRLKYLIIMNELKQR